MVAVAVLAPWLAWLVVSLLSVYLLNLLIGFLSPMVDPELEALD